MTASEKSSEVELIQPHLLRVGSQPVGQPTWPPFLRHRGVIPKGVGKCTEKVRRRWTIKNTNNDLLHLHKRNLPRLLVRGVYSTLTHLLPCHNFAAIPAKPHLHGEIIYSAYEYPLRLKRNEAHRHIAQRSTITPVLNNSKIGASSHTSRLTMASKKNHRIYQ